MEKKFSAMKKLNLYRYRWFRRRMTIVPAVAILASIFLFQNCSSNSAPVDTSPTNTGVGKALAAPAVAVFDTVTGYPSLTTLAQVNLTISGDSRASQWCVMDISFSATVPAVPSASSPCWSSTRPTNQTLRAQGLRVVLVYIQDAAGEQSEAGSASINFAPNPVGLYEAETGTFAGAAALVGARDGSSRAVGDLGGEASGRQAVTLSSAGDSVSVTVAAAQAGASFFNMRYSIPDAPGGGGQTGSALVSISSASGALRFQKTLKLTSRYAWLYGGIVDGTKFYNTPANALTYAHGTTGTHMFDEIQFMLPSTVQAGDLLTVASLGTPLTVDFVELEVIPLALTMPPGFLSITDPSCGAIPLDVNSTGQVFDGLDDSSYASIFNTAIGKNPFNPTSAFPACTQTAGTQEKDYYSSNAGDTLQDEAPSIHSANMSMFQLADHNAQSIKTCISLVTGAGSGYVGVWIPPGRFYARGVVTLPSNLVMQGAGMYYSKFVAVDTMPPTAVTNASNGCSGIAATSGNLKFSNVAGGSSNVTLSSFSMFGNQTQRDSADQVVPQGVGGYFSNSRFSQLWFEHYTQGIVINQNSTGNLLSNLRSRNVLADGIDFYGLTSNSTMQYSQSRGNGDDGFAIWSQGTTSQSTGNSLLHSSASLQWYGNGFAVYGGDHVTLDGNTAADTLVLAGLKVTSEFVTATLPSNFTMNTVNVSNLNLYRCGGNANNGQNGAVLLGAMLENVSGITLQNVNIWNPSYAGYDFRVLSNIGVVATPGSLSGVVINNSQVYGPPVGAKVSSNQGGDVRFSNVCTCQLGTNAAGLLGVTNSSGGAFTIDGNSCSRAQCTPF